MHTWAAAFCAASFWATAAAWAARKLASSLSAVAFLSLSSRLRASLESGTGWKILYISRNEKHCIEFFWLVHALFIVRIGMFTLKKRSVRAHEFPSPLFQHLVKIADWDRWHSELSGFGGGLGTRGWFFDKKIINYNNIWEVFCKN